METCARCALETVRWKGLEYLADVLQVTTNVTMAIWEHSGKPFVRVRNAERELELAYFADGFPWSLVGFFKQLAV